MQTTTSFSAKLFPSLLASGLVLAGLSATNAVADEKHAKPPNADHAAAQTTDTKFGSVGEAWAVADVMLAEMATLLDSKDLKAIHPAEEKLSAALKYLAANSPMVTGDKAMRLAAALKQTLTVSGNVHSASDAGDQAKTAAELKKLRAGLVLVRAQYPAEALKAPPGVVAQGHGEHAGHGGSAPEPTMKVAAVSVQPLAVGQKADVTLTVQKKDGAPVTLEDLEVAHTEKIHVLIIDPSLSDYHHEHPKPTGKPGEYALSFTPRKPGSYRIWADLVPKGGEQEYVIANLAAQTKAEPVSDRAESLKSVVDGLTYKLSFKKPLVAGDAILGTLTVADGKGTVFPNLEPIMGAYAHIVGFSEDFKTIAHIHPMGEEPTKETDRGAGKLDFHIAPEQPGMVRLFAQVQIGGVSKFAPFTLNVQPETKPAAGHAQK